MTNLLDKILRALQVIGLILIPVFEHLTTRYPLVMRHIYTKKILHLAYLTTGVKSIMTILLVLVFIVMLIKGKKSLMLGFVTLVTVLYMWLPITQDLMVYTYGLGIVFIIWLIEWILSFVKR